MLQSGTTESSLRKTYEEGYLTCSTAVYYEGQGNEQEAMRCWRAAVEQLRRQQAHGNIPEYALLNEAERALSDSLRELQYQAQERLDLLEALNQSRQEDPFQDPAARAPATPSGDAYGSGYNGSYGSGYGSGYGSSGGGYGAYGEGPSSSSAPPSTGYIGGGTIPAITYSELARPEVCRTEPTRAPPPVPPRLSAKLARAGSYERAGDAGDGSSNGGRRGRASFETPSSSRSHKKNGGGSGSTSRNGLRPPSGSHAAAAPDTEPEAAELSQQSSRNTLSKRSSRSPTKDKPHTLRPTLRGPPGETTPKSSWASRSSRSSTSKSAERQGASKAATLAWTALGLSSIGKSDSARKSSSAAAAGTGDSASTPKAQSTPSLQMPSRKPVRDPSPSASSSQPALQWDSNSRRLVPQRSIPDPASSVSPSHSGADLASAASSAVENRHSGEFASSSRAQSLSLNAAASALGRSMQAPAGEAAAAAAASRPRTTHRSASHQRPSLAAAAVGSSTGSIERTGELSARPKSTGHTRFPGPAGTSNHSALGSRVEIRRNVHSSYAAPPSAPPAAERSSAATALAAASAATPQVVTRKKVPKRDKAAPPRVRPAHEVSHLLADVQLEPSSSSDSDKLDENDRTDKDDKDSEEDLAQMPWKKRAQAVLKHLPPGVDPEAAKQILNEIVVQGDVVHWGDIAGLEPAKKALREVVVYPFLRPDLFMGLREPATGMLLFGPPGTGKTMLARAVATESRSTFFSISASSLTSKYLGESEKLVRALFALAKTLAPSIIVVDEIDSILSQRSGSGEHEATRRIKTEFLIQWSDLQRAAAGREDPPIRDTDNDAGGSGGSGGGSGGGGGGGGVGTRKGRGDASRVLVLAATNLPWAIDEAARRRFVRRQYIPLPERETRAVQLRTLLGQQKHSLTEEDIQQLVELTDALAKDAAMGPLRSLGEALLMTKMDEIRPMELSDFVSSLVTIRPSVSKSGLKEYEDWARAYGERGG